MLEVCTCRFSEMFFFSDPPSLLPLTDHHTPYLDNINCLLTLPTACFFFLLPVVLPAAKLTACYCEISIPWNKSSKAQNHFEDLTWYVCMGVNTKTMMQYHCDVHIYMMYQLSSALLSELMSEEFDYSSCHTAESLMPKQHFIARIVSTPSVMGP